MNAHASVRLGNVEVLSSSPLWARQADAFWAAEDEDEGPPPKIEETTTSASAQAR